MADKQRGSRSRRRTTKDRVLQARIPEQLDEELRDRAEQLGLSVSTIVRNTLLHTFNLVEGVVADSAQIGRALQGKGAGPAPASLPDASAGQPAVESQIFGWQEAVLNQNAVCDQCNTILPLGERAAIGVPVSARPRFLCLNCLAGLAATRSDPVPQKRAKKQSAQPAGKS